jgi:hypothetical protein
MKTHHEHTEPETLNPSSLIEDVGTQLTAEYHEKMSEILSKLRLFDLDNDPPHPLEVWKGIAQAIADHSGYRVVLEAEVLERSIADPTRATVVAHRELAKLNPTIWVREAPTL